jgi:hypothetical protein
MLIIMANSSNVHLCIEAAPSVSDAGASIDRNLANGAHETLRDHQTKNGGR